MATTLPSQQSPAARAFVFGLAALIPLWAHAKDKYHHPQLGGWLLLAVAEVGLLVGVALLLREAARRKERFDGLAFDVPWMFELFFGGLGALILGFTLYATSIIGAGDLSFGPTPRPSAITPVPVAAAIFFSLLGGALILVRPVFDLNESGARCTLFGLGLPVIVLQIPSASLDVVAIEKPVIDASRRIVGVVAHIRGKAGALTFSLPSDAGIPTALGNHELQQKDAVIARWRTWLAAHTGPAHGRT